MAQTKRSRVRAALIAGTAVLTATGVTGAALRADASETTTAAGAVTAPAARGADARNVRIPGIPKAVKPPAGSRPIGAYLVQTGTQTYRCTGGVFTGASTPEAQLIGTGGRLHHFAGPSWQSVRDQSLVTASKVAESPRDGTIPELLLKVQTRTGDGVLSRSDYISRLLTSGGTAPAGACTDGSTTAVPYGAVYVFWDDPAV